VKYEVLGFTLTVDDEKGGVKSVDCEGSLFSSQAKQYIEQYVKAGRVVTIDKIRVKDPSGRNLKLSSLVYYIQ
jgi:ribosomal protein L18E